LKGEVPPLLFGGKRERRESADTAKEKESRRRRIALSAMDWESVEPRLERAMLSAADWAHSEDVHFPSVLSVRVVLQYLVGEGTATELRLVLSSGTKAQCPGFYDCAGVGRSNALVVVYRWQGECRTVAVADALPLSLPNERHAKWIDIE